MEKMMLHNLLKEKGVTWEEMAMLCGISSSAFRRRMEGTVEFTLGEIEILAVRLALCESEIRFIFFGEKVS